MKRLRDETDEIINNYKQIQAYKQLLNTVDPKILMRSEMLRRRGPFQTYLNQFEHFLSLHPEDIVYAHVFNKLSLKDLFNLRCCSKPYQELVDGYLREMKVLNLHNYKDFSEHAFKVLNTHCTRLNVIKFYNCAWLTNDLVTPLFQNNPHITSLDLSFCVILTPACLQPIIISCKNLKDLNLNGNHWMTSGCLESLTFHHENLQSLKLAYCYDISQETLHNAFLKFSQLHTLDLSKLRSVDNSTIKLIYQFCRNIRSLIVCGCMHVNTFSETFKLLKQRCKIQYSPGIKGQIVINNRGGEPIEYIGFQL